MIKNTQTTAPCQPILRRMGGKAKLATLIIPALPKYICYLEAFCGGAAIGAGYWRKEKAIYEREDKIHR